MQLPLNRLVAGFILSLMWWGPLHAAEISTIHSQARALGMGDAFSALAADSSALFYNPAGLARVAGINWKVLGARAGTSGLTAYKKIQDLQNGNDFASQLNALYGEHVQVGFGGESAFTAPMVGFSVFNHADILVKVDDPVYPQNYMSAINDYGYVLGVGFPMGLVHAGFALKYIRRSGVRKAFGPAQLSNLDPGILTSEIAGWGRGYGVDTGLNIVIPAPFFTATLATVWRNVGQMHFRSDDVNANIPMEDNDVTLGLGLSFSTPLVSISPAIDVRYLNSPNYQLTRKLNFGLEIGLPLVDIRGGFHEGYYTYGVGLGLGLLRVDAVSYGVELGAYPGQIEDRRYMVELSFELGVGSFSATGSSNSGGTKSASGSSSSSSSSIWGGRGRLKQRR